jgi:MFS family permease
VAPIYDLGAILGALSCIFYSDKIGRLRTIACGMILGLVSLAIQSSAYSLAQLIVGRILVGAAVGITSASVPVWQTECSTTKHRGMFVIMEGIFISGGIAMSE